MSQLTEAQKLDFVKQIKGNLANLKDELAVKDFDVTKRIAALDAGGKAIDDAEVEQTKAAEQAAVLVLVY